jgi:arylsulfatase A-like enzyme
MNRRELLQISAAPLLASQAKASRPNIVFILADDLGYGDLGCYGQRRIATPNIDRLSAEGTRFTQAYAGSTVCAPSRCCLLTGRHTGHATVRGNKWPEIGIRPDEVTLPALLKRAGYKTALAGKWGLGGPGTTSVPNTRGFDEFFGFLNQVHAHNSYPEHLWENQDEYFLRENWFDGKKQFAPDLCARRAVDFLKRDHGAPFFLYFATTIPHANNELGRLGGDAFQTPNDAPYSGRDWPRQQKNLAALITRLDSQVGGMMAVLKEKGIEENTLVIFSSDNGPEATRHAPGYSPDFFGDSGPLRGIKRDLYEGGIRVPLVARWPGKVPAGRVSDDVLAFWDFLPTLAELAGVDGPAGIDGISMVPALLGRPQKSHPHLYWEFHERGFAQAIRIGDWKGVRLQPGRPVELYNLRDDQGERKDVAATAPEVVREIEHLMDSSRTDSPDFPIRDPKPTAD